MSKLPESNKALFIESPKGAWVIRPHPVHVPAAGEILVRVEAAGLNPVDWEIHDWDFLVEKYPVILGYDGAGVVVALGEGVDTFKVGDRVFFPGAFNSSRQVTYQHYSIATVAQTAKLPASLSFDQGASMPSCIQTAAIRLYTSSTPEVQGGIGLTPPWKGGRGKYAGEPILILGGSSAVGQAAIQFASLSGFSPIITTVSTRNVDFVTGLGATHALDRNQDAAALTASIRSIAAEKTLRYVLDAVSVPETQNLGYKILADAAGGTLMIDLPCVIKEEDKIKGKKVEILNPLLYTHPVFVLDMYSHLEKLLEDGDLKPHRVDYVSGGLGAVPDALDRLRKGEVSGAKLIVRPQETV